MIWAHLDMWTDWRQYEDECRLEMVWWRVFYRQVFSLLVLCFSGCRAADLDWLFCCCIKTEDNNFGDQMFLHGSTSGRSFFETSRLLNIHIRSQHRNLQLFISNFKHVLTFQFYHLVLSSPSEGEGSLFSRKCRRCCAFFTSKVMGGGQQRWSAPPGTLCVSCLPSLFSVSWNLY